MLDRSATGYFDFHVMQGSEQNKGKYNTLNTIMKRKGNQLGYDVRGK